MAACVASMKKLNLKSFKKSKEYVVAVDGSNCSRFALKWTDFLANPEDKLTIIHSSEAEEECAMVKERYAKYPKRNDKKYSLEILDNSNYEPQERILHFVNAGQKSHVDILVTGYHGITAESSEDLLSNDQHFFGTTSDLSLRSARCSSLFVKKSVSIPDNQSELRIVVGVDGSQNSRHAFEFATKLLKPNNTMFVIHIKTEHSDLAPPQYQSKNVIQNYTKLAQDIQKKRLKFKVNISIKLVEGIIKISEGLCKFAQENNCHLLVVGADGMTAHCNQQPILGSVSDECVKDCYCNTLVTQINEYSSTPRSSITKM